MNQRTQPLGMGARIGIGFVVVLVLMVALGATGLRYVAEANQRLKDIAQGNNVKTELATVMHSTLRERALAMHALPILADPFEKDIEVQRFNTQGTIYMGARERLERMPLSREETRILAHILELTREAQPAVQAVVEMAIFSDDQQAIFEHIRSVAMPRQRAIAEQVGVLLQLQREQTAAALRNAEASYERVRNLMLGLGTMALMMGMAIAWVVSQRVTRQAEQLATQAIHDPLTGLANRAFFYEQLTQAMKRSRRQDSRLALLYFDIDKFKQINDSHGHDVGDEIIRRFAHRVQGAVREVDFMSRIGGDEFVLILEGLAEARCAEVVANKLLDAMATPFTVKGRSLPVSTSIGIALYQPGMSVDDLVRQADQAMYRAKERGKNRIAFWSRDKIEMRN